VGCSPGTTCVPVAARTWADAGTAVMQHMSCAGHSKIQTFTQHRRLDCQHAPPPAATAAIFITTAQPRRAALRRQSSHGGDRPHMEATGASSRGCGPARRVRPASALRRPQAAATARPRARRSSGGTREAASAAPRSRPAGPHSAQPSARCAALSSLEILGKGRCRMILSISTPLLHGDCTPWRPHTCAHLVDHD